MGRSGRVVVAAWLVLGGVVVDGAEPSRVPTVAFPLSTERVQVDVVVRDKKGAILRGLRALDFEVYEDGARQEVESLDLLERALPSFVPAAVDSSTTEKITPTFVALAFDRLSPGARTFAQQAVLRHLDARPGPRGLGRAFGSSGVPRGRRGRGPQARASG
jgi:hypothetical protein